MSQTEAGWGAGPSARYETLADRFRPVFAEIRANAAERDRTRILPHAEIGWLREATFTTLRRVVLPLLRPTVAVAFVYGFVRAMTAVSAVIFLVSAEHNLSTTYILAQVESGQYGRAIAYSCVLILAMLAVVAAVQLTMGRRQIGRRALA